MPNSSADASAQMTTLEVMIMGKGERNDVVLSLPQLASLQPCPFAAAALNGHGASRRRAGQRLLEKRLSCYRLSRHATLYNGDLRTSSTVVLDRPMSASSRSSSSRSSLY